MRSIKGRSRKTVSLDCPVCYTGNYFQLAEFNQELECSDCGFVLADASALTATYSGRCVFCYSQRFYFDSPLFLKFLGRSTVCYVCEARYRGVTINEPDETYNYDIATHIQESEVAISLKERVERYNKPAG